MQSATKYICKSLCMNILFPNNVFSFEFLRYGYNVTHTSDCMAEERLTVSVLVQDHKREWASCEDIRAEFLLRFIKRALSCETL